MNNYLHKDRPWLKTVLRAAGREKNLYCHGCESIEVAAERFMDEGKHTIELYDRKYEPNPFFWQYDLEFWIFLNYEKLRSREIKRLRDKMKKKWTQEDENLVEFRKKYGPTGIPRHEHLFNAAEIRWPTREAYGDPETGLPGRLTGSFIRDPWAVRRMEGVSNEKYNFVAAFGGGGQGKTWTYIGFLLMLFEHFIFTRNGAKVSVSTVNEDKIKGVQWPDMIKLHNDTDNREKSLYAGRSIIAGDFTIKRPNTKDTAGVFRAILVGRTISDQSVIDKLTGTHEHAAYGYLVDEAQSTPKAPIEAAGNYMSTGTFTRIILTGNYGEEGDTLDSNIKPKGGWDKVDTETQQWASKTTNGHKCWVMHFNNNLSPAFMDKKMATRFPYLPNKKKRNVLYPSVTQRNPDNMNWRRFWIGWRSNDIESDRVLTSRLVKSTGANKKLDLSIEYPVHTSASFDSAESMGDRNVLLVVQDGRDPNTEEWIWGIKEIHSIDGVADPSIHHQVICDNLVKIIKRLKIKSGDIVIDGTKNTGHAGFLFKRGIRVVSMVYHKRLPDGKIIDRHSKIKKPAILVNQSTNEYGHQIVCNEMSFGAWLLREYVLQGKVRGINDDLLIPFQEHDRSLDDEIYRRKLESNISADYGERLILDSKKDFKNKYGFSTDLFDVLCQAAYFMFVHRRIPLYEISVIKRIKDIQDEFQGSGIERKELMQEHASIWTEEEMVI